MASVQTAGKLNYVGNPDYRGYLNYLAQSNPNEGIRTAAQALIGSGGGTGYVNNQGQLAQGHLLAPQITTLNSQFYKNYLGLTGQGGGGTNDLAGQLASAIAAANYRPTAPPLNVAQINAQARAAAEKAINPLYVKKLNNFLAQQNAKQAQYQGQYNMDVQNIQDTLGNQLESNQTQRGRVQEDTATNLANIATSADQFQTDTGQQNEQQRQELGQQLASTGLTGGLARGKVQQANEQQNTAEQRQQQQFSQAQSQQKLLQSRSLSDLLKSDELAKTSAEKGKKQAKFNLDNYLKQLSLSTKEGKMSLEEQRQERLLSETQNQRSGLVSKFIQSIGNSGQRAAAYQAYGNFL